VRPPRVHITYEVEIGDAIVKKELPFVLGAIADLSGQPAEPLKRLREREFVTIDRDNFDQVLARMRPRLAFRVDDKLTGKNQQIIELVHEPEIFLKTLIGDGIRRGPDPIEERQAQDLIRIYIDQVLKKSGRTVSKSAIHAINDWIGEIDQALSRQMDEILH